MRVPRSQPRRGILPKPVQGRTRLSSDTRLRDPEIAVSRDDPSVAGKIGWSHLKEMPDHYERLGRMERERSALVSSAPEVRCL
jgi:hypothetical protein